MNNPQIIVKNAPFKRFCMSIGAIPTSYLDSLDYYETLLWLIKYLEETIIPTVNNNGEAVSELQSLYIELKNYVDNYFTNLDVQEEINNKLDDMVEDGTLTDIIGDYIEVAKKSYLIEDITVDEIYVENNKGSVFITKIPHTDSDGNIIKLKHGFANDEIDTGLETPTKFSYRNHCSCVVNASVGAVQSQVTANIKLGELLGLYIYNGEVIKDNRQYLTPSFLTNRWILGITDNDILKTYIGSTDATTILNDGVVDTYQAFIPLMVDGNYYKPTLQSLGVTYWSNTTFEETTDESPIYEKIYYTLNNNIPTGHYHLTEFTSGTTYYDEITHADQRYVRQIICQDSNKNIFFITNNGKGQLENVGLSLNDFYTLAKYYQATFAFVLDGGGSTCTVVDNIMINNPTDDQASLTHYTNGLGYTIREVPDFIYFNKEMNTEYDENINNIYNNIQNLNKKINDNELKNEDKFKSNTNFYENTNQQHIFNFNQWDDTLKNFITTMKIYFNNTGAYPSGINIEDPINNIEVLRLHNNINDGIRYLGNKLAIMFNNIPTSTDTTLNLNALTPNANALLLNSNLALDNQPFTYEESHLYWLIQWGSGYYLFQIALSVQSLPKLRIRTKIDGTWQPWREISITSIS